MSPRIFRYVVRYDTGTAPNPYGGWCSLAICKPKIRSAAQVGDWIIGLRSQRAEHVIYAMQVEDVLPLERYWYDTRFRAKRPDSCETADNIYRPADDGSLEQVPNRAHGPRDVVKDLGGRKVILGRSFWYFGDSSPRLPDDLLHLVHVGQSHSVHVNRMPDDTSKLRHWLSQWPSGIHGLPIDRLQPGPAGYALGEIRAIPSGSRTSGCTPDRVRGPTNLVQPSLGIAVGRRTSC
jgi:hypothetical protein